jgi:hypothetical protein
VNAPDHADTTLSQVWTIGLQTGEVVPLFRARAQQTNFIAFQTWIAIEDRF